MYSFSYDILYFHPVNIPTWNSAVLILRLGLLSIYFKILVEPIISFSFLFPAMASCTPDNENQQ